MVWTNLPVYDLVTHNTKLRWIAINEDHVEVRVFGVIDSG